VSERATFETVTLQFEVCFMHHSWRQGRPKGHVEYKASMDKDSERG